MRFGLDDDWRPTATLALLRERARVVRAIRAFFDRRGVLEVETPILSAAATTDPAIASLQTRYRGPGAPAGLDLWLHTSPEFAMKRLLAAGSGPIFQLGKVFRDGERGRWHNPEFTLLEWYRPGFDHHALIDEVAELVNGLLPAPLPVERLSYAAAFADTLAIDPHRAGAAELRAVAIANGIDGAGALDLDGRDAWLDLLLSHRVEPRLGRGRLTFLYDYPASQAALARVRPGDPPLAERFELYWEGVELANGFHELNDPAEQATRFAADLARRRADRREVPPDRRLVAALAQGLPACAGVALGVDRLLMRLCGAARIDDVIAFPLERA